MDFEIWVNKTSLHRLLCLTCSVPHSHVQYYAYILLFEVLDQSEQNDF